MKDLIERIDLVLYEAGGQRTPIKSIIHSLKGFTLNDFKVPVTYSELDDGTLFTSEKCGIGVCIKEGNHAYIVAYWEKRKWVSWDKHVAVIGQSLFTGGGGFYAKLKSNDLYDVDVPRGSETVLVLPSAIKNGKPSLRTYPIKGIDLFLNGVKVDVLIKIESFDNTEEDNEIILKSNPAYRTDLVEGFRVCVVRSSVTNDVLYLSDQHVLGWDGRKTIADLWSFAEKLVKQSGFIELMKDRKFAELGLNEHQLWELVKDQLILGYGPVSQKYGWWFAPKVKKDEMDSVDESVIARLNAV